MKLKIVSYSSLFRPIDEDNEEIKQVITITDDDYIKLRGYNLKKELIRNKKQKLNNVDVKKIITDIKEVLDNPRLIGDATDVGSWDIEIDIDGNKKKYSGCSMEEFDYELYDNKTISNFIRSITNLNELLLLDGNAEPIFLYDCGGIPTYFEENKNESIDER